MLLSIVQVNRWCSWLDVAAVIQPTEMKEEALQSQAAEISDESRKEEEENVVKLAELKQQLLLRMYERDQRCVYVSLISFLFFVESL